jgi:hypothetical protein
LYNDGSSWLSINVTAHYFEVTPYEYYDVTVYRTNSPQYGGVVAKRTSAGMLLSTTAQMGPFASDCGNTCCTDSSTHTGWYYAQAQRVVENITEAKAKIRTRYGKLCGEPYQSSSTLAHSTAHVGIASGDTMWAQTGFIRFRDSTGQIDQRWYFEGVTPELEIRVGDLIYFPIEDTLHEYKLELESSTGKWFYYFDGHKRATQDFWPWIDETGNIVYWTGEIRGHESDMPGTSSNRCYFTDCQYKADFSWHDAGLYSSGIYYGSDDDNEWVFQRIDQTSFYIWDVIPLP